MRNAKPDRSASPAIGEGRGNFGYYNRYDYNINL